MIDDEGVMVLPEQPFVLTGAQAVADAPRWTQVTFSERQIMRPQEGLIAIAYKDEPAAKPRRVTPPITRRRCAACRMTSGAWCSISRTPH
jgi:hypothetical protein